MGSNINWLDETSIFRKEKKYLDNTKEIIISEMEYELVEKQDENGNMIVVKVF